MDMGKNFLSAVRGDIDGFGVVSDLSVNAFVVLGYRITDFLNTSIGYRA